MKAFIISRGLFLICLFVTVFFTLPVKATHISSAELTFHGDTVSNSAYRYFFKLVLYTEKSLTEPDDIILKLEFGDGISYELVKASQKTFAADTNKTRNVYYVEHEFPGPGLYNVSFKEVNRAIDYVNITRSEHVSFFIQATVILGLEIIGNRSPIFLAPYIPTGVLGQPYRQNVTAYDPDGDSLVYKLLPAMEATGISSGVPIASYQFPVGATINSRTGEFIWPAPDKLGRHAVMIEVWEYRQGILLGKVMREISLIILPAGVNLVVEIKNRSQVPVNARNQVFVTSHKPVKIRVAATNAGRLDAYSELISSKKIISALPTADSPPEVEYTIKPEASLRRDLPYILTFRGTAANAVGGISQQQNLTLAVYFRPERAIDQQDTTQPGEWPGPEPGKEPGPEDEPGKEPKDEDESLAFKLYPNPAEFYFYIDNKKNIPAILYLYNVQNQVVLMQPLSLQKTLISCSSTLVAGMYFYTIISEAGKTEQSGRLVFR